MAWRMARVRQAARASSPMRSFFAGCFVKRMAVVARRRRRVLAATVSVSQRKISGRGGIGG
jgi:hypothetical protein